MSMATRLRGVWLACLVGAVAWAGIAVAAQVSGTAPPAAQTPAPHMGGGEASLVLPDLGGVSFQGSTAARC